MGVQNDGGRELGRSEWTARLLGVVATVVIAALAWRLIRWPAPAISVVAGLGVYALARRWLADPPPAD